MLGVCLCGAGRMGKVHARSLSLNPQARLLYVADVFTDAAETLAARYGARSTGDLEVALADPALDAVIIATPSLTHPDLLITVARAGKAIFCEKPLALETRRAIQAAAVVRQAGVPNMVGFNKRFDPSHAALATSVHAGQIGQVEMVLLTNRDPRVTIIDYLKATHDIAPHALVRESTVHDLDMARWLLGAEPVEVYAAGSALIDPEIAALDEIDTAMFTLKTAEDALCHINNSWRAVYGYDQRIEVFGSQGMLRAENRPTTSVVYYSAEGARHDRLFSGPRDSNEFFLHRYAESYQNEMNYFVESLCAGVKPSPSIEDGLRAQLLVQAAVDSLVSHKPVTLDPNFVGEVR